MRILLFSFVAILAYGSLWAAEPARNSPDNPCSARGIRAVIGLPESGRPESVVDLAAKSDMAVYFQSPDAGEVQKVREAAEARGLLGSRLFAARGSDTSVHLADNLADEILVAPSARVPEAEALRVLRPGGKARIGGKDLSKPAPAGIDEWSHPYRGPDNNPQSADKLARAPYLTQFVAGPAFGSVPEIAVAAGGRIFRAFGHIAFHKPENGALNTLFAYSAYNGMILWTRPLQEGFMIHRNTMIATPEMLLLGDAQSCKLLEAATGRLVGEVVVPDGIADGRVWKWMALEKGILYALVGGEEIRPRTRQGRGKLVQGWGWGMWEGFDYKNPKANYGFGRTFLAVDLATRKVLWTHREDEYVDSRGTCMKNGRIYYYCAGKSLACLNLETRKVEWRTTDAQLLAAIGADGRAQFVNNGFSPTPYVKCTDRLILFAGPQRPRLVAVSAADGRLAWSKDDGNFLLVLRKDAIWAAGVKRSYRLDYETGRELELGKFPAKKNCAQATGSIDSIFFRGHEGTLRYDVAAGQRERISTMRPGCMSGVTVSDGQLYWGPFVCGCALSLFGHICVGPAGEFDFHPKPDNSRLETGPGDGAAVKPFELGPADWPGYRQPAVTPVQPAAATKLLWAYRLPTPGLLTAAAAVGTTVFVGGDDGVLRALDGRDGRLLWKAYTGGAIKAPPSVWNGRVYVGSGDGRAYAFEAATGRHLWSYRVALAERRIPVYGRIGSTWPVAGVAVADGTAYAAAGMAHYDGTYAVALDAVTGKLKWSNDTSGLFGQNGLGGISPHGPLYLADSGRKVCFAGGSACRTASFDVETGKCLTREWDYFPGAKTYFYSPGELYAWPRWDFPGGWTLVSDHLNGIFRCYVREPDDDSKRPKPLPRPKLTITAPLATCRALVLAGGDTLLAAGTLKGKGTSATHALVALRLQDGQVLLTQELPAEPCTSGLVVDREGRVIVSLLDGSVVCLGPKE